MWLTVRTSYATLLQIMTLYMVFLPYSFLMNTSHNKYRVVEHGWKNVLRNLLGRKSGTTQCDDRKSNVRYKVRQRFNESQKNPEDKCVLKIFTTRLSANITDPNRIIVLSTPALLCEKQSTSKGHNATNKTPYSSSTSSINTLHQNDNEESISKTLVLKMIEHINDEEIYIEHFKNLVTHRYNGKNGTITSEFHLEKHLFPNCVPDDEMPDINPNGKRKQSKQSMSKSSKRRQSEIVMNVKDIDGLGRRNKYLRKKHDRIAIRGGLLNQIINSNEKDDMYNSLIEELINVEENFVE